MYLVRDSLPVEQLNEGSYLLSGPAMSGKYELLLDLLASGLRLDDGVLVVSTNNSAFSVYEDLQNILQSPPDRCRFVDCVSDSPRDAGQIPDSHIKHVSSPGDLTGIGIGVSEQLNQLVGSDNESIRVGFHSLSTLLMYAELETVFRFVHVLAGRIDSIDGIGFFVIDPTTHDESTVNTLKQLFNGMIELRDDDRREIRFAGIPDTPSDWIEV